MKENEIKVSCKVWFYLMAVCGRGKEITEDKILNVEKMENVFKGISLLKKASYVRKGEDDIFIDDYCNGDVTIRANLTIASVDEISKEEMEVYSSLCDCALIDDDDGPYEMALLLCFDDVYRVAGKEKMKKGKTLNVKES